MEPKTPQPPTKLEFLEYLKQYLNENGRWPFWLLVAVNHCGYRCNYGDEIPYSTPTLADFETFPYLLLMFKKFQSEELRKNIFHEYFIDDWRSGQEIRKVIITQRFYQVSPNSTQA